MILVLAETKEDVASDLAMKRVYALVLVRSSCEEDSFERIGLLRLEGQRTDHPLKSIENFRLRKINISFFGVSEECSPVVLHGNNPPFLS